MRAVAVSPTCLALLLAFLAAPFQHVHAHEAGAAHDHAATIHTHFYSAPASRGQHHGPEIDDSDQDHAAVWSLDTFTLVAATGLSLYIPVRGPALAFVPLKFFWQSIVVEQRGHDPPCVDRSIPRAPPS